MARTDRVPGRGVGAAWQSLVAVGRRLAVATAEEVWRRQAGYPQLEAIPVPVYAWASANQPETEGVSSMTQDMMTQDMMTLRALLEKSSVSRSAS